MKVKITKDGYIEIIAETNVEAWALNGLLSIENIDIDRNRNIDRCIINCSVLSSDSIDPDQ